jgi:hypothetical protein
MQRCAGNWNQRRSHRMDEKKGEISPTPPQAPRASARSLKWMLHYSVTMGWDTASCASDYCTYKATPRSSPNARGCMLLNDNAIAASRFPFTSPPPKCRMAAAFVRVAYGQTPVSPLSQVFGSRLRCNSPCGQTFLPQKRNGKTHLVAGQNWHSVLPPLLLRSSDFCFVDCRKAVSDFICYIERGSQTTHILGQIAR